MNNPKAIPRFCQLSMPKDVGAGLQRLPGASFFHVPSIRITTTIVKVDRIPKTDVYERRDSGKNTVGINLHDNWKLSELNGKRCRETHKNRPHTLYVLDEYCGKIECSESPYKVTRITLDEFSME